MERKEPIRVSGKTVLTVFVGVVGALALGIGMCFTMVWGRLVTGIVVGILIALRQRLKEIKGGEENDASQY